MFEILRTLDINDIFILLIRNVLISPEEFIGYCETFGMKKKDPVPDVGQYSQFPKDYSRYCYEFDSPGANSVNFEILVTSDVIMQAGANLYYKNSFTAEKKLEQAKKMLDIYFGPGVPMQVDNCVIYNYGNEELLGYVSIIERDSVNLKVGNAKVCNSYYPIK